MADLVHLLLLEDNPGDTRLLREYLADATNFPVEVTCVERMADALEKLGQQPFSVVLSDLSLPDSRGLHTFIKLRARAPDVPIVLLTGFDDEALALEAVQKGAQDYLVKGQFNTTLLVRSLRYAIERQRIERERAHYAAVLRERNAQLQADLELARQLQVAMLPQPFSGIPAGVGLEDSVLDFFSFYYPTAAASSDSFTVIPLTDKKVGIFICDLMGHSVRATLVTAMMRALVQNLPAPARDDPGQLLATINRGLLGILRQTHTSLFATAAYLIVDIGQGEVSFANAGHPSPLHLHRFRQVLEPLEAPGKHGPALGLSEEAVYPTQTRPLGEGDLFLLFTDGLFELKNPTGQSYDLDRLVTGVKSRSAMPAGDLFRQVMAEIEQFAGPNQSLNDICLIGCEVRRLRP